MQSPPDLRSRWLSRTSVSDPIASEAIESATVATMVGTATIDDIVTTTIGDIDAETAVAK